MMHKRVFAIMLSLAMLIFSGCGPSSSPTNTPDLNSNNTQRQSAVGFYFDTVVRLTVYGAPNETLEKALELCAQYEALLSRTVENSDVWKINHANGKPVEVSEHTLKLIETANEVSRLSDGAFDITIAPASSLWNFNANPPALPDEKALNNAAARIDYTALVLDGNLVTLPVGYEIDLGGIAKGYIADQLALFFEDCGASAAIINLGGNIVTLGEKPDGTQWSVGIQDPYSPAGTAYIATIAHSNSGSFVTSGAYERGFELDGVRYHHILDPSTGYPVQNELASVTIISKSSMLGDALSTACFVLGQERSLEFIKNFEGVEAIFLQKDGSLNSSNGAETLINQD